MSEELKTIAESGTAVGGVISKLFPGIAKRSEDNAASDSVQNVLRDLDSVLDWINKNDLPDSIKTAAVNFVFERRESTQRVTECIRSAAPIFKDNTDIDDLDQEWLDYWRMHAEKVRDSDVQAIWGAILAGEVNNPGTISKRTMSILADMEKRDAEAFVNLCSYCIGGTLPNGVKQPLTPMFIDTGEQFAMDSQNIARLRALGLIDFTIGSGFGLTRSTKCMPEEVVQVGKTTYVLAGDGNAEFTVLQLPFTEYGEQIASYCAIGEGEGFADALIQWWKGLGFKVGVVYEWINDCQANWRPI